MAFGNKAVVDRDSSKQEKLREERKTAMFSANGNGNTKFPKNVLVEVPLDLIDSNPDNEKVFNMDEVERLAEHIREVGYDNASPVALFEKPDGRYELSAGHRRFKACQIIGVNTIPAIIRTDVDSANKAKALLDSNMYNRVLKAYDYAQAIVYYRDNYLIPSGHKGNIREALCDYFHMGDATLQRYLSILKLIPELQEFTKNSDFPSSVLGNAVKMSTELQYELYEEISKVYNINANGDENHLTARQLSELIEMVKRRDADRNRIASQKAIFENSNHVDSTVQSLNIGSFNSENSHHMVAVSMDNEMGDSEFETTMPVYGDTNKVSETVISSEEPKEAAEKQEKKQQVNRQPVRKQKPDVTTVISVLSPQIAAINLDDFDVANSKEAEKLITGMIEELNNLLDQIKGIGV